VKNSDENNTVRRYRKRQYCYYSKTSNTSPCFYQNKWPRPPAWSETRLLFKHLSTCHSKLFYCVQSARFQTQYTKHVYVPFCRNSIPCQGLFLDCLNLWSTRHSNADHTW